jgi:hypothetical protein
VLGVQQRVARGLEGVGHHRLVAEVSTLLLLPLARELAQHSASEQRHVGRIEAPQPLVAEVDVVVKILRRLLELGDRRLAAIQRRGAQLLDRVVLLDALRPCQ